MARVGGLSWQPHRVSGEFVAVVYAALSLSDMLLSSAAFFVGIPEANPVLAWLEARALFFPAKVLLTAVATGLIAWLYPRGKGRRVAWLALLVMAGVNAYHLWGLSLL